MSGGFADQHAARERLAGLDSLRGIAACVVAFGYHAQFLFAPGSLDPGQGGPLVLWLRTYGWTAVDLFFVLSGYVFAHVYLQADHLASRAGQRRFWTARIARLYPLHALMLVLCAGLFAAEPANTLTAFAAHAVFAQAFVAPVGHTFNGPTWSLSVEMVCYGVFALAAAGGPKRAAAVAFAAACAGLVAILAFGAGPDLAMTGIAGRGLLGFFTGTLMWRARAFLCRVPAGLLLAALVVSLWLAPQLSGGPVPALTLLGWPALLVLSLRLSLFTAPALRWLGDRSYAVYLLHIPLIDLAAFSTGGLPTDPVSVLAAHAALSGVTLIAADLVYRRFEMPMRVLVRGALVSRGRGSGALPAA